MLVTLIVLEAMSVVRLPAGEVHNRLVNVFDLRTLRGDIRSDPVWR